SVVRAVENALNLLAPRSNVLVEINNEANVPRYEHPILQPERVHELVEMVAGRLPVGTSYTARSMPSEAVLAASDVVFLHGNGVTDPPVIGEMVEAAGALPGYRGQPIVFNEDDHFDFEKPTNNMVVATEHHA